MIESASQRIDIQRKETTVSTVQEMYVHKINKILNSSIPRNKNTSARQLRRKISIIENPVF